MPYEAKRLDDALSVVSFLGTASVALAMMSYSIAVAGLHALVRDRRRAERT